MTPATETTRTSMRAAGLPEQAVREWSELLPGRHSRV